MIPKIFARNISDYASTFFFLFFAAFLIFNLFSLGQYGVTWDEPAQQHLGQVTNGYLLGKTNEMHFLRPDLIYYGPFFELVNQWFGNLFEYAGLMHADSFHVLIVLIGSLGLLFFFLLVRRMLDSRIALWGSLFLGLSARFVAHIHYNTKDIPLTAGLIIALYFLFSGLQERRVGKILTGGIIFGLTAAVRMDALFFLPIFALAYLLTWKSFCRKETEPWRFKESGLYIASAFFLSAAAALFLGWPALWSKPLLLFQVVDYFLHHGWPGQVLYFGQIYLPTELPWHYGPLLLAMTTPLAVFLLFGAGVFRIIRQNITLWRDRQSYQVENQELFSNRQAVVFFAGMLFLSWIFFRLLLSVMPGAVRYDGIRHFLPLLPAISVIAAIGLSAFMESILQCCGKWSKSLKNGILAAILLSLIWEFSTAYPFGDSYFNEGTRIIMGPHLEKVIEVEYWGPSYRQGVRWLNQNAAENAQVCVPLADHLLQFYPIRSDIQFQCDLGANYLMFITRYAYLPANLDEIFRYSQLKPVYRISRQGSDLLLIYKLDK